MHVKMLSDRLTLTESQQTTATRIYTDAENAVQSIRQEMRTTQESMNDAVKQNNTAVIDQLAAKLGSLTGQSMSIERKADAAFFATLTADQQGKFRVMPMGPGFGPMGAGRGGQRFGRRPANQ